MNSADASATRRPNNSRNNNATRRARNQNRLKNAVINASTFPRNATRNQNRLKNAVVELNAPPAVAKMANDAPVSMNAITAPRVEPWPVVPEIAHVPEFSLPRAVVDTEFSLPRAVTPYNPFNDVGRLPVPAVVENATNNRRRSDKERIAELEKKVKILSEGLKIILELKKEKEEWAAEKSAEVLSRFPLPPGSSAYMPPSVTFSLNYGTNTTNKEEYEIAVAIVNSNLEKTTEILNSL